MGLKVGIGSLQTKETNYVTISVVKRVLHFFSFEMLFVMFLFAGRYKADPRFAWIPIDITELFSILSICVGFQIFVINKFKVNKTAFLIILFGGLFVAYVLLSLIWSVGFLYAREKAIYISTLNLWALIASALIISQNIERVKRFIKWILIFSCWVAIESTIAYIQIGGKDSISALGGNYLGLGRVLGLGGIIFLMYSFFLSESRIIKLISICVFIYYIFLLLVIGGRGPLISLLFSLIIPLFFKNSFKKSRNFKRYVSFIIVFIVLGSALAVNLSLKGDLNTLSRFLLLFEPDLGRSAGTRAIFYKSSLYLWTNTPFFGGGIGSWPHLMGFADIRIYPHNLILELIDELGIVGLFLFGVMFIKAIITLIQNWLKIKNIFCILILVLLLNGIFNSMVSGDLTDNRIIFAFIGLAAYGTNKDTDGKISLPDK